MKENDFDKIYDLIDSGEYVLAREAIDEALKVNESDIDAHKLMALCDVNLENYESARCILENIVKHRQDDALIWYYLGCCYDNLGDLIAAKHAYLQVLELRPEYIDAFRSLAIVYIKAEKFDEAIETAKKAIELSGDDYSLYYVLGTACMASKRFEDSVTYIEKAIELNPENLQLYNNLGTSYLTIGNFDMALATYEKALKIDETDALTYFNIASILQIQEKHVEACEYFAKAHQYDPEDDNYIVAWAVSEVKAGMFREAIEHYKFLASAYPQKTTYKFNLACCYQVVGEYEIAISLLKQLVMMNPKAANFLKKLASIYIATGQLANAKEIYEKIIKQGTVAFETYYELAMLCTKTGDSDRAEQILKKVIGLNPEFAAAHKDLGVIYLNKRLFDYAKDEFEKAYQLNPNNASIVVEYANYLHSTSDFVKADEFYEKALALEPENINALAFSALNKTHLKQIDVAKEQVLRVLEKCENSAFLLYVAGRIHHLAGDFEDAKMYLIKAYELEQLPDVQNLLGLCYLELGNFEQAKTIFMNMYEKLPLNVNVLLSIAKCCEKLGQNDEAISYAEKLVEHFEECEEAHEIIRRLS